MAGLDKNTQPFSQQPAAGALKDADLILIAQPWAQGLAGYKTVNTTIQMVYTTIMTDLKTTGITSELGTVDPAGGLTGTGGVSNPLRANMPWISENFAIAALTNVSQVGNLARATLPIGSGATGFSYPIDGLARAAFASPTTEGGFNTLVPVTNGFDTTYNYGSGIIEGNDVVTYTATEDIYIPNLPEGYNPSDYTVSQIFSSSKTLLVIKLKHYSGDRSKDELAVVVTDGSLDGAYHHAYFLEENNLYAKHVAKGLDAEVIEAKFKYTAFESNGEVFITRFDISPLDTSFGDKPDRRLSLLIYKLKGLNGVDGKLSLLPITGFKSQFQGTTLDNISAVVLSGGLYGVAGSELDLSIVKAENLEFKALDLSGQSLDRFLDVFQYDDGSIGLKLSRTAYFYVRRSTGSRQQFIVNYAFEYVVDLVNKTVKSVSDGKPQLVYNNGSYSMVVPVTKESNWNGATGAIETRCECNFTITTPTTSAGNSIVTMRDSNGNSLAECTIRTVSDDKATIAPNQTGIPLCGELRDGQTMVFISGTEVGGYKLGGLNIATDDTPTYKYINAKGDVVQGYSLDLERFTEQRYIDGVNLSSYSTVYSCSSGEIFNSLSGYDNTTCTTRFSLMSFTLEELRSEIGKRFKQQRVELDFTGSLTGKQNLIINELDTYVEFRSINEWLNQNYDYLNKGNFHVVPFFDGKQWKAFVRMSLVGAIGVGCIKIHLITECIKGDNDYTLGAVIKGSVVTSIETYNGEVTPDLEQPDTANVSVFAEASSGKIAIFYSGLAQYTYGWDKYSDGIYRFGFGSEAEILNTPYSSNFGIVTYYLDKVNGVSFTTKDSWLKILQMSEPVDIEGISPMIAMRSASEPMLLAAPLAASAGSVAVTENIPIFLAGINTFIPPQTVELPADQSGQLTSKFYLYCGIRLGEPYLTALTSGSAERPDYTMIAVIVRTNATNAITVDAVPFMRLGVYRLNTRKRGASIPVTAPRPDIEQFTLWD